MNNHYLKVDISYYKLVYATNKVSAPPHSDNEVKHLLEIRVKRIRVFDIGIDSADNVIKTEVITVL